MDTTNGNIMFISTDLADTFIIANRDHTQDTSTITGLLTFIQNHTETTDSLDIYNFGFRDSTWTVSTISTALLSYYDTTSIKSLIDTLISEAELGETLGFYLDTTKLNDTLALFVRLDSLGAYLDSSKINDTLALFVRLDSLSFYFDSLDIKTLLGGYVDTAMFNDTLAVLVRTTVLDSFVTDRILEDSLNSYMDTAMTRDSVPFFTGVNVFTDSNTFNGNTMLKYFYNIGRTNYYEQIPYSRNVSINYTSSAVRATMTPATNSFNGLYYAYTSNNATEDASHNQLIFFNNTSYAPSSAVYKYFGDVRDSVIYIRYKMSSTNTAECAMFLSLYTLSGDTLIKKLPITNSLTTTTMYISFADFYDTLSTVLNNESLIIQDSIFVTGLTDTVYIYDIGVNVDYK